MGVKNGAKLSESLRKTTEGYAVAVGQMKVVISVDANKPLCATGRPRLAGFGMVLVMVLYCNIFGCVESLLCLKT